MSSISSVGSASSAWPDPGATRAAMKERMFAKVDTDGSGGIDKSEMQAMLKDISSKSGMSVGSADELMTKMDSNGDGNLSSDELDAGMRSLLPAPSSTVDFAQQHGRAGSGTVDELFTALDADGSGGLDASELNTLLDQVATSGTGSSDGSIAQAVAASANAAVFGQLDTDGDGTIGKAELSAAVSGPPPGPPPTAAPPAGGAAAGASGASGTSSTTTYDPLDTNEDGVVSAQERMVGEVQDLMKAMDTNGDQAISASEVDSFISQLAATTTHAMSSTSDSGSGTGELASKASRQGDQGAVNMNALGDLVREEYTRAAANYASTATVDVAA